MPHKDSEERKKYQRQQMRRRRAEAKGAAPSPAPPSKPLDIPAIPPAGLPEPCRVPAPIEKPLFIPAAVQLESDIVQARIVAEKTEAAFAERGWVMWKCSLFNGEKIVIIRDEMVKGYPDGYPVYTDSDLRRVTDLPDATVKLIHEAKKRALVECLPLFKGYSH